tara:strand:- start:436 stop:636 length:201 start_codon:yes stop_codon:yes gene_type:complete
MTLVECYKFVEELESDIEKKIEWTMTDYISQAEAKKYTKKLYDTTSELKEKLKELIIIDEFNENST